MKGTKAKRGGKVSKKKKGGRKKKEAGAEDVLFTKNPSRSYVLRDIWFRSLMEVIDQEEIPEGSKRELMFLTLSNAILDMMMDILPENVSCLLAKNLDDYLAVTVVNQERNIDLLQTFQEEFEKEKGTEFEDETQLLEALDEFEDRWWNAPRKELDGKTPNDAVQEVADRYEL